VAAGLEDGGRTRGSDVGILRVAARDRLERGRLRRRPGNKGVLAFDTVSGAPRWSAACPARIPQFAAIEYDCRDDLVLMLSNDGLRIVDPASGQERLNYE
jgi:hypothetical protein